MTPDRNDSRDQEDENDQPHPRDDRSAIPEVYLNTIKKGFGPHADLFEDVLQVSPEADPRQIRIAYFRRGREILTEGGVTCLQDADANGSVPSADGDALSGRVKARFESISMAYEIVSTPSWKEQYLQYGLLSSTHFNADSKSVQSNDHVVASVSQVSCASSRPSTIRWNEHVEELVFDRAPEEIAVSVPQRPLRKKRQKQPKAKILFDDSAELDEHLRKLDAQAEQHFVADFWDSLEESLDGLLKFTVDSDQSAFSFSKKSTRQSKSNAQPGPPSISSSPSYDSAQSPKAPSQISSNNDDDDDAMVTMLEEQLWKGSTATNRQSSGRPSIVPLARASSPSSEPFRCISPDPLDKDAIISKDQLMFDVASIDFSDNSIAESSNNDKQSNNKAVQEEEDVFEGLEELEADEPASDPTPSSISLVSNRAGSPSNASVVSDLSESVANRAVVPTQQDVSLVLHRVEEEDSKDATSSSSPTNVIRGSRIQTHVTTSIPIAEDYDQYEDEQGIIGDDACGQASAVLKSFSFGTMDETPALHQQATMSTDGDDVSSQQPNGVNSPARASADDQGLVESILAYLFALVQECETMGKHVADVDWQDAILRAFVVDEEDMDTVMSIVHEELRKTPAIQT